MKTRLTLNLTQAQAEAVDWLIERKGLRHDERHPRDTVGELLLDYARELRGRDDHLANVQHAQNELRIQLDAMRRERDGVAKALKAERTNRRRDRQRHAALRASLRDALKTVERVKRSRDRYRDLVARARPRCCAPGPATTSARSRDASVWRCARRGSNCRPVARRQPGGSARRRNAKPQVDPRLAAIPPGRRAHARIASGGRPAAAHGPLPAEALKPPLAPCSVIPPETPLVRFVSRCSPPRWEKVLTGRFPQRGGWLP